jgi:hypothetical protein
MSINTTEIRVFGAVSGSDRVTAAGRSNLRAGWWRASGEFLINVAVKPGSALAVSQFGSPRRPGSARSAVYGLTAYYRIQKARGGFSGAGFILATMKICR